jgi:hypothetical protein
MSTDREELIVRYLMGEVTASQKGEIEQRLFTEPGFLESVRATEERLIRDAVVGELPPNQLEKFHKHFLSFPDLRRKYEATIALRKAIGPGRDAPRSASLFRRRPFRLGIAVAAGLALFLLFLDDIRLRSRGSGAVLSRLKSGVITFVLEPGLVRASRSKQFRLAIPSGAVLVQIRLKVELSDKHSSYRASLVNVDLRQEILRVTGLVGQPADGFQNVVLEVPATLLSTGSYALTLYAGGTNESEAVEGYSFEAVRSD